VTILPLPLTWTGPRTTVDLAHSLGLTMVAEGVENETALLELAVTSPKADTSA
jgi:hypothetical protein